jgi:lysophospholipase
MNTGQNSPRPMPDGGTFNTFAASDGAEIRYALWPRDNAKATVILQGGFSEFIEKHYESTQDLLDRGFAVAAMDWRCQGHSARHLPNRNKVHVESFDRYIDDFKQFVDTIVAPNMPGPILILAHSMGGHLVLRYLHDDRDKVKAAILSAPMVDIWFPLRLGWVARLAVKIAMWRSKGTDYASGQQDYGPKRRRFEGNKLSSDPVRFRAAHNQIDANPDLTIGGPTNAWLEAAFASIRKFDEMGYLKAITTPLCLVQSAHDRIVSNAAQN